MASCRRKRAWTGAIARLCPRSEQSWGLRRIGRRQRCSANHAEPLDRALAGCAWGRTPEGASLSLATKRQAPRPRSNGQPRLLRPASHWIGLTSPMSQEPGRTRESGMRWALRFFGLTKDQRRQPVPSQTIQAAVILAVIGLAVWLATNSSHHALSLHRVAAAVFGVGLGTALAGGVSRWRAKRRHDS